MPTTVTIELIAVVCCDCGVVFGLSDSHKEKLLDSGGTFYCPNGCAQHFTESSETKIKELKRQLEEERRETDYWRKSYKAEESELKAAKNSLRATKGALTKTKRRVANGVCPCCNRHFTNLQRHMESKHPEYAGSEEATQ